MYTEFIDYISYDLHPQNAAWVYFNISCSRRCSVLCKAAYREPELFQGLFLSINLCFQVKIYLLICKLYWPYQLKVESD